MSVFRVVSMCSECSVCVSVSVCECQDDSCGVDMQMGRQAGAVGKWTRHLDTHLHIV